MQLPKYEAALNGSGLQLGITMPRGQLNASAIAIHPRGDRVYPPGDAQWRVSETGFIYRIHEVRDAGFASPSTCGIGVGEKPSAIPMQMGWPGNGPEARSPGNRVVPWSNPGSV